MNSVINNSFQNAVFVFCLGLNLLFVSCAPKFTPVYPEALNIQSTIKPGDSVKIVTKTDEEFQFKVQEISSEAIMGSEQKVMFTDIYNIEKTTAKEFKNVFTQAAEIVIAIPILLLMSGCC